MFGGGALSRQESTFDASSARNANRASNQVRNDLDSIEQHFGDIERVIAENRGNSNCIIPRRQVSSSFHTALQELENAIRAIISGNTNLEAEAYYRANDLLQRIEVASIGVQSNCPPAELERRLSQRTSSVPATMSNSSAAFSRSSSIGPIVIPASLSCAESAVEGVVLRQMSLDEAVRNMAGGNNPTEIVRQQSMNGGLAIDRTTGSAFMDIDESSTARETSLIVKESFEIVPVEEEDISQVEENELATSFMRTLSDDVTSQELRIAKQFSTVCYSWGRGDLGCLLHRDLDDHSAESSKVEWGRDRNIVQIASSLYHTAAITATGEALGCGSNEEGQVVPQEFMPEGDIQGGEDDSGRSIIIRRPILIEPLQTLRIMQVACGLYHTVCLTSYGVVVTFGGNEAGQLGHSFNKLSNAPPMVIEGLTSKAPEGCMQVAAGDMFTLCLTTQGEVLSCGLGDCVGGGGLSRNIIEQVSGLAAVPVRHISAGSLHSVAVTKAGNVYCWGMNTHGQAGRKEPNLLLTPMRVLCGPEEVEIKSDLALNCTLSSSPAVSSACGSAHTVVLLENGGVRVCGLNRHGQLGHDPRHYKEIHELVLLASESEVRITEAACGISHTLLLSEDGKVWSMGDNAAMQLGTNSVEDRDGASNKRLRSGNNLDTNGENQGFSWQPTVIQALENSQVVHVAAGGYQSFAIACPCVGLEGTLFTRQFSVLAPIRAPSINEFEDLVRSTKNEAPNDRVKLIEAIRATFGHPHLLNASLSEISTVENGPDLERMERLYVDVIACGTEVCNALSDAVKLALTTLKPLAQSLDQVEALRCVIVYWMCPLHGAPIIEKSFSASEVTEKRPNELSWMYRFMFMRDVLLALSIDARRILLGWIKDLCSADMFMSRFVLPLKAHLAYHLKVNRGAGTGVPSFSILLQWLYGINELSNKVSYKKFYSSEVSAIPIESLVEDLKAWRQNRNEKEAIKFFFSSYSFLLDVNVKRLMLLAEAEAEQRAAIHQSGILYDLASGSIIVRPFMIICVDRQNLLKETLMQVEQTPDTALKKQLKVIFKGEEGVDEGGVRKELFQLLIGQLFDVSYGMFVRIGKGPDGEGVLFFNRSCEWNLEEYQLIGTLLGLAVYNGVLLDIQLPLVVYKKLLGQPVGLDDLSSIDSALYLGFKQLLDYVGSDVEDIFCRTFEVEWDAFGMTSKTELLPGGADIPVTAENKEMYVSLYISWLLRDSIQPQFEAFEKGFSRVMGTASLQILRAEELELLVAGSKALDFVELQNVSEYEGGYSAEHQTIQQFWEVIHNLDSESKRRFLFFATGCMRAPAGGLGKLSFKIQRAGPDSNALPTSHTCFNTLLLPEYSSIEILKDRLILAITECEGFGLK